MFRGTHTCMGAHIWKHMCAPTHVCAPRNMNVTYARVFDENAKNILILPAFRSLKQRNLESITLSINRVLYYTSKTERASA